MDGVGIRSVVLVIFCLLSLSETGAVSSEPIKLNIQEHENTLFVHVETLNPLHHFKVVDVYACSSVDLEMEPFSIGKSSTTGCSTPGFVKQKIYNEEIANLLSNTNRYPNKFRTSMSGRTLIIHEMMVDARAPVVYIEMHLKMLDENGRLLNEGKCLVYTTRYVSLEHRAEPIIIKPAKVPEGSSPFQSHPKDLPWYYLTVGGLGVALVVVGIVAFLGKLPGFIKKWRRGKIVSGMDLENGQFVNVQSQSRALEKAKWIDAASRAGWYRK